MKNWDVIVIGGGIIGLSLSIALRKRGATVLVVERGEPGREASHAAGGMLVDCPLETPRPLQALATASAAMYPEFAHELELESGIKVDLRDYGTILFPSKEHISHAQLTTANLGSIDPEQDEPELRLPRFQEEIEMRASLHERDLHASREEVSEIFRFGLENTFYLKVRSVDPRALTAAAFKTAKARGVDFSSGDPVTTMDLTDNKVSGITSAKTSFRASQSRQLCWRMVGTDRPLQIPDSSG